MRYAAPLLLAAFLLGAGAGIAPAQETPPRARPDRERPRDARELPADRRFDDELFDDEFAEDSLALRGDTLPRVDVEARRQELAGTGGFPERDSLFRSLLAEPGFVAIEYRGRETGLEVAEEDLSLIGDAQVNRGSDVLTADTILYDGRNRFMEARRSIELVGGAGNSQVTSDSVLYFDFPTRRSTVYRAETQFNQSGTNWRVLGNVIPRSQDTLFAGSGRFTSCEQEEPHYTFRAGKIKVVSQQVIVAWPVVLYVSNVPVFWLPFFASDIRQGRRSGILPPRFGLNDVVQTSSGAERNVTDAGYYWAISEFTDAQATLDWFSDNYTRINGRFNYRWLKSFIRGGVFVSQSFSETGDSFRLDFDHDQEFGLDTRLRASLQYVQDTRTFQDQSFRPDEQTRTIDSDVGLNRRFRFGNLSASARRRQFLSDDRTETTFPSLNMAFSPLTLFRAPRSREGAFNNIVLSGSGSFTRRTGTDVGGTDRATTSASGRTGLTLRRLSLSGSANFTENDVVPQDSLGNELPGVGDARLDWNAGADYQIDLVGSTTLRPTVSIQGTAVRRDTLDRGFVKGPTRANFGATLSTDVYGFFPGFGPFSRIRHKVSPNLVWQYAPAASVDSVDMAIFPGEFRERNTLTVRFNQTFEAKVRPREPEPAPPDSAADPGVARDSLAAPSDSLAAPLVEGQEVLPGDSVALGTGPVGGDALLDPISGSRPAPARRAQDRAITLLAITTDALTFDFAPRDSNASVLVTEKLGNRLSSDLLRGFQLSMRHDLFEGGGAEPRNFSPFLESLVLSFSLRSGAGLGDLIGLGGSRSSRPAVSAEAPQTTDTRYRLSEFADASRRNPFESREGGAPWGLSLRYSLLRSRPDETAGRESETLDGTLTFQPTPKWSVRWTTQYSFSDGEFGSHFITLDRDLHRWRASFQFSRSPNGNTLFSVSVRLVDAPEIQGDYIQRSN
ncbi:MAG: putative LPS assembly protein LptD [Gemmatimonadota bacterium]|nr:putative LPS assembly protein LptD [Gemmatimonadota bacterium]